jgi:hypothetical protein
LGGRRGDCNDLVKMLVKVAEAAVVGMLMNMSRVLVSIAFLDATEFPYCRRDAPGNKKRGDDHIAENPKVESGEQVEELSF